MILNFVLAFLFFLVIGITLLSLSRKSKIAQKSNQQKVVGYILLGISVLLFLYLALIFYWIQTDGIDIG